MAAKIGDHVRFLNSVGGGTITKIDSGIAYVEDDDGFVTPVMLREVVVVESARPAVKEANSAGTADIAVPTFAPVVPVAEPEPEEELEPFEETPEGEKISVMLAFVPSDSAKPNGGSWEMYLINDSNYWLSFGLFSKDRDEQDWKCRTVNTIEPSTQLFIEEVTPDDLNGLERLMFQYFAFKKEKSFGTKKPLSVVAKLDATKFFKLHCFMPNIYFDEPVLSLELVKEDRPAHEREKPDQRALEELRAKRLADLRPSTRRIKKKIVKTDPNAPLVVDLHIEELVDNLRGLSSADMLNRQIDEFRAVMDSNLHNKGRKLIFIHGKGEGVLRNAILKELNHRYKGNEVQDASFREYGFGATQVTIK